MAEYDMRCFRIILVYLSSENEFEPHPENEILVPVWFFFSKISAGHHHQLLYGSAPPPPLPRRDNCSDRVLLACLLRPFGRCQSSNFTDHVFFSNQEPKTKPMEKPTSRRTFRIAYAKRLND